MKKVSTWLWGGVLVALGVILALNALDIFKINIFFPGWWTLFLIVPGVIGLLSDKHKTGDVVAIVIGVALLLACLGIMSFGTLWKLILPVILVIVGLTLMVRATANGETYDKIRQVRRERAEERHRTKSSQHIAEAEVVEDDSKKQKDGKKKTSEGKNGTDNADDAEEDDGEYEGFQEYWSTFGEQDINFGGKKFGGCRVDAVFGGADLDLRQAKIKDQSIVSASSIFGGIIIYVPDNVNVEMASTGIFGGASDKRAGSNGNVVDSKRKTLYIDATCVFGGVEIR